MSLEKDISDALLKCELDKIRIFDLVKMIDPDVKRNKMKDVILSFLPLLSKMEENKEFELSWKELNSTKEYPRFIIRRRKEISPLWRREIEDIMKNVVLSDGNAKFKNFNRNRNEDIKSKVIRFNKLFEEKSGDIVPSGDWQKVFMIFMENNVDHENIWVACVEAFKAGVLWNIYKDQLENGNTKTKE